jgi:mycofactocin glycosyltransferase
MGGSPWRVTRLAPAAVALVERVEQSGPAGAVACGPTERRALDGLVERGLVHPVAQSRSLAGEAVVVIPSYGRADLLDACLRSLATTAAKVVVVDDGSPDPAPIAQVANRHGARLVRLAVNQGPAAARNAGIASTTEPLVVFLDSDCSVPPGWLEWLAPLFDDPRVAAVAPRVRPVTGARTLLARHEDARSSLDMGRDRRLVRPGGALGFLPSAALIVRRDALQGSGFDPDLRLGEDVDLVWRLAEAGWHVRYEPTVTVRHTARLQPREWAGRRFAYGTSAADLNTRHPGRLAPVDVSAWSLGIVVAAIGGRPRTAFVVAAAASLALGRRLEDVGAGIGLAAVVVGKGLVADTLGVGHALRREWWPIGWLALGCAPRSRIARAAAAAMLTPIVLEWVRTPPGVDPVRYAMLRLVEDAAYGSGVIVSSLRSRTRGPLTPRVRLPKGVRQLLARTVPSNVS